MFKSILLFSLFISFHSFGASGSTPAPTGGTLPCEVTSYDKNLLPTYKIKQVSCNGTKNFSFYLTCEVANQNLKVQLKTPDLTKNSTAINKCGNFATPILSGGSCPASAAVNKAFTSLPLPSNISFATTSDCAFEAQRENQRISNNPSSPLGPPTYSLNNIGNYTTDDFKNACILGITPSYNYYISYVCKPLCQDITNPNGCLTPDPFQ